MLKYHIQTIKVGSGGSTDIVFNNIPQIYDDLLLVTSLRDNVASTGWENAFIYPNNSSANMASRFLFGWSSNTGSGVNNPAVIYHQTSRGNNTSNTFSSSSVVFCGYASSGNKRISAETTVERNDAAGINAITEALWSNSSPITSLSIVAASGSFVQYSSASLYGIKRGASGQVEAASGGTVSTSNGYTYHTFNSSGTFVANRNLQADVLVVAGGGSGGYDRGSGGGAGGYLTSTMSLSSGNYLVNVGAGGSSQTGYNQDTPGTSSVFSTLTALGGGSGVVGSAGRSGGSGSGAGSGGSGPLAGGAGTVGQGNNGGASGAGTGGSGGGGGAGAVGGNGGANNGVGGAGGAGLQWLNATFYAGGGGGGAAMDFSSPRSGGAGGTGGGGSGGNTNGAAGAAGTANTGGGGGGGANIPQGNGGAGGSGVVIIRYLTPA